MTAQHPAAPETETDANGLTETELETIHALHREIGLPTNRDNNWQPMVSAGEGRTLLAIAARHAALLDHVRVVEGERDAARADVSALLDRVRRDEGERIAQAIEELPGPEGDEQEAYMLAVEHAARIARAASVGRGEQR